MAGLVTLKQQEGFAWASYLPVLKWGRTYDRETFVSDLIAGLIVAVMLVPQGMAYALLAGLPPQVGLYASIVPLLIYGLLGTSRSLSVGPTAVVSLLVVATIGSLTADPAQALVLALLLAFLVGVMQLGMGLLRIGFMVNFLSHPVLSAFTSAAAILIAFSQLKHLLGFPVPRFHYFYEQVVYVATHLGEANRTAVVTGVAALVILFWSQKRLPHRLEQIGVPQFWRLPLTKMGPLLTVVLGICVAAVWRLDETAALQVIGAVPSGLPTLTWPALSLASVRPLLPAAFAISLVGYMESVSVAKALASKRREKIDPDQELIALGLANIGASFTGGFPVTGGISRSVVNFSAGARTGMASIITAVIMIFAVLFMTPIFYFLPQAILAANIVGAVVKMIDFKTFVDVWRYNKGDGIAWLVTFVAVLWVGVEYGILYGAGSAILIFVWRTSRPHIAVVGRLDRSEIYRNVLRHEVVTWPEVVAMRVDQSLYFANTKALETAVLGLVADRPEVKQFVLIGTAVNFIDASAVETLDELRLHLQNSGVELHLAAIKGPVLDQLKGSDFYEQLGTDKIHLSTHEAMQSLGYVTEQRWQDDSEDFNDRR